MSNWLSPFTAVRAAVGGADLLPNVNNPFNSTTDGTKGTTGDWGSGSATIGNMGMDDIPYYNTTTNSVQVANPNDFRQVDTSGAQSQQASQQAARQGQMNQFGTAAGDIRRSAQDQLGSSFNQQKGSILDYFQGDVLTGQNALNTRRTNAEMSRNAGSRDIMGMVGRGIQGGNVMLANKNASSSSAKGQIARAYGQLGNQENVKLQGGYASELQDIGDQQGQLDTQVNTFATRKMDEWKATQADSIANAVRDQLAQLNMAAQGADLGTLFQIEQEKQAIKDQAMQKFSELDGIIAAERAKITPLSVQDARGRAMQNEQLGQGAPQMFDFNSQVAAPQMRQASQADLPLYSSQFIQQRRRGV